MSQKGRVELEAKRRSVLGSKVKRLRREGWVPGVIYGHGFEPVPLKFDKYDLRAVLSQVGGSQLINVKVDDADEVEFALLRDVQRDVITGDLLHVDFYRVMMTETITTEIPLLTTGESPIAERKEGILLHGVSEIEVECLPGDLVDAIEVDLSELTEIGQAISVGDLAVPSGVNVLTDPDEMIARLVPLEEVELERPAAEVEEELILGEEGEEVEVIGEAEEGEEGEEEEVRDYM
ncbi:MAG: 50S ribosomal protein L25 [Chloroflexota bacterium]|nr:50S ribosomal protein L25 [Chloroflexota bacterium]